MNNNNYFEYMNEFWRKILTKNLKINCATIGFYSFLIYIWNSKLRPNSFNLTNTDIMSALNIRHNKTLRKYKNQLILDKLILINRLSGLISEYTILSPKSINTIVMHQSISNNDIHLTQSVSISDTLSRRPIKEKNSKVIDQWFEEFWGLYPKKNDKNKAKIEFLKLKIDKNLFDIILNGLHNHKYSSQWQDPKFIPYPANWLSKEKWTIQLEQVKTYTHEEACIYCSKNGLMLSSAFTKITNVGYLKND
jgi:hypothetical protein